MDIDVRFVDLPPMRVAVAHARGERPEEAAWAMILDFARDRDLDPWSGGHRFFGFNDPDPAPGRPEYGYQQWMTVDEAVAATAPLEVRTVPGGRYAVVRVRGIDQIGAAWRALLSWCDAAGYAWPGDGLCLEELLTPLDRPSDEWEFDLYRPVTGA